MRILGAYSYAFIYSLMSSVRELQELFLDSRLRGNDEAVELLRFSPKMDMSVFIMPILQ